MKRGGDFCPACVWGSGTGAPVFCQVRLNGYRRSTDRRNKDRSGMKRAAKSVCVCVCVCRKKTGMTVGLDGSVQCSKSTQSTREGFHRTDLSSPPCLKQAEAQRNKTFTNLPFVLKTLFVLNSLRKVTERPFLQLLSGWMSSTTEAHLFTQKKGELENLVCPSYTQRQSFLGLSFFFSNLAYFDFNASP